MKSIDFITLKPKDLPIPEGWVLIDAMIYQGNLEITIEER